MKAESRILILSVVLLVVSLLLSLLFGSVNLSPSELLRGALQAPKPHFLKISALNISVRRIVNTSSSPSVAMTLKA